MALGLIGMNHLTQVDIREQFSFTADELETVLADLLHLGPVAEAVVLCTCNRTEVYYRSSGESAAEEIVDWIVRTREIDRGVLTENIYRLTALDSVAHLYRVISGLDSMVLGEIEIVGQVKDAYYHSHQLGGTGKFLNKLFHSAFEVNKQIRTETEIGRRRISVSRVAVKVAASLLNDLSRVTAMVIGAGEMGKRVLQYLIEARVKKAYVANRTLERSHLLTDELGGVAVTFDDRFGLLEEVDLIIAATACPVYLIREQDIPRRGRPLYLIDLSVPRDVDPQVGKVPNCHLLDIDDLRSAAEREAQGLQGTIEETERIIDASVEAFDRWLRVQQVVPLITALQERAETMLQEELQSVLEDGLSEAQRQMIERCSRRLVNRFLHSHLIALKQAAIAGEESRIEAIRDLFDLDTLEG
ncbi:MAG: glutamyl-tRNA reductase [Candidatus Bipolaricaulia bacterium]